MMKKPELKFPEDRNIQGLYSHLRACESFWTLKARVDLAIFREQKELKKERVKNQKNQSTT
jgi:hypothetical protein